MKQGKKKIMFKGKVLKFKGQVNWRMNNGI